MVMTTMAEQKLGSLITIHTFPVVLLIKHYTHKKRKMNYMSNGEMEPGFSDLIEGTC